VEILASVDDRTELLVMELATRPERTIDGIANGREIVSATPRLVRMRAGLACFVTLAERADELSNAIVAELDRALLQHPARRRARDRIIRGSRPSSTRRT
jgi:hypothetical protein